MVQEIKALCKENGITVQGLALHFGWGANSINRWDDNRPSVDKVIRVADYFGVSMDYLCGRIDYSFLAHIYEIINKYRSLDENGKNTVNYIIDNEIRRIEEKAANAENIVPLWVSRQPASAGRGVYLSADEFDSVIVVKTKETNSAAFAVPVTGDSMEPIFHDGDIVLVGRDKTLKKGDFGVFTVNGCGYIKQLGDNALISLNKEYDDIPLDENTVCNGKVIGVLDKEMIL